MAATRGKRLLKQILLPPLVLFGLDLIAGVTLFGHTSGLWLFKNTQSWVSVAGNLAFVEGILCILVGVASGIGDRWIVSRSITGAEADVNKELQDHEKSTGWGFRMIAYGVILILLTIAISIAP
jgi:hypothetical protein